MRFFLSEKKAFPMPNNPSPEPMHAPSAAEVALDVAGMDFCASCVAHVAKAAPAVPGVRDARVELARGRAVGCSLMPKKQGRMPSPRH